MRLMRVIELHYSGREVSGNAVAVTYTLNATSVRVLSPAVFCLITGIG
ncbi:hypothetical protein ACLB1E_08350 [Escherichia coli]